MFYFLSAKIPFLKNKFIRQSQNKRLILSQKTSVYYKNVKYISYTTHLQKRTYICSKTRKNMFIIIGIMFAGMLLGFLLRKQRLSWIHKVITVFIWLLLFLLGIDVGSNQEIINGLHTIGLEAVILTLAAVLGSVTAAWALWYMVYKRNRRSEA